MSDRREPQARAILRRLALELAPHELERLAEQITAELARTDDTETLAIALPPLGEGATATIWGAPATLAQRFVRKLHGQQ